MKLLDDKLKHIFDFDLSKNYIRKVQNQRLWKVYGESGKSFGTYTSPQQAEKRLSQMHYWGKQK